MKINKNYNSIICNVLSTFDILPGFFFYEFMFIFILSMVIYRCFLSILKQILLGNYVYLTPYGIQTGHGNGPLNIYDHNAKPIYLEITNVAKKVLQYIGS